MAWEVDEYPIKEKSTMKDFLDLLAVSIVVFLGLVIGFAIAMAFPEFMLSCLIVCICSWAIIRTMFIVIDFMEKKDAK